MKNASVESSRGITFIERGLGQCKQANNESMSMRFAQGIWSRRLRLKKARVTEADE